MTEEIIIDGVNVAGCCCFENNRCLWTKRYYESDVCPMCEKINNCYYKQLKRLEEKYDTLTNKFFNSETDKTRLEQENKELEKKLNAFVEHSKTESDKVYYKMLDYKTVLEEIKKIAEDVEDASSIRFYRIKRKINEVLNDK